MGAEPNGELATYGHGGAAPSAGTGTTSNDALRASASPVKESYSRRSIPARNLMQKGSAPKPSMMSIIHEAVDDESKEENEATAVEEEGKFPLSEVLPNCAVDSNLVDRTAATPAADALKPTLNAGATANTGCGPINMDPSLRGYLLFVAQNRERMKEFCPDYTIQQISQQMVKFWKELPEDVRKRYEGDASGIPPPPPVDALMKECPDSTSRTATANGSANVWNERNMEYTAPAQEAVASSAYGLAVSGPEAAAAGVTVREAQQSEAEAPNSLMPPKPLPAEARSAAAKEANAQDARSKLASACTTTKDKGMAKSNSQDIVREAVQARRQDASKKRKGRPPGVKTMKTAATGRNTKKQCLSGGRRRAKTRKTSEGCVPECTPLPGVDRAIAEVDGQPSDGDSDREYLVKVEGLDLTRYAVASSKMRKHRLLNRKAANGDCGGSKGGHKAGSFGAMVREYSGFCSRFWNAVSERLEDGELNLENLPEGSPLEICYYLGKLLEKGGPLSTTSKAQMDTMIKVPMMGISMAVQRFVDYERDKASAAERRVSELEERLKSFEKGLECVESAKAVTRGMLAGTEHKEE